MFVLLSRHFNLDGIFLSLHICSQHVYRLFRKLFEYRETFGFWNFGMKDFKA